MSKIIPFNDRVAQMNAACPKDTPWGPAQTCTQIAPGIWLVTTAGHGGYWLRESRLREMPPAWKGFVGFSDSYHWFEEDCDWAVVAVCFPDHFNDYFLYCAFKTLATLDYAKERFKQFLDSADGRILFQSSVKWEKDHGHLFHIGVLSSSGHGWDCSAYRIDGQERLVWHQDEYPMYKHPFDKSQLARFEVESQPFPPPATHFADLCPSTKVSHA